MSVLKDLSDPLIEVVERSVPLGDVTGAVRKANVVDGVAARIAVGCLDFRPATPR